MCFNNICLWFGPIDEILRYMYSKQPMVTCIYMSLRFYCLLVFKYIEKYLLFRMVSVAERTIYRVSKNIVQEINVHAKYRKLIVINIMNDGHTDP